MLRHIFHIRLKEFEIQAERILDAGLRTRAVAIISSHHQNGTIVGLSPEAREEGLHEGMKVSLARKMSHGARLLPYNNRMYARLNRYLYQTLSHFSPLVEPARYGQFHIDMTGMDTIHRSQIQAGHSIFREIQSRINLSSQVGISTNKLVSRIATEVAPEQIHEVTAGNEPGFLAPLPSQLLPSAQEKPVQRIIDFLFLKQVLNIQNLVRQPRTAEILFGQYQGQITRESQGEDTSMVKPPQFQNHIIEQKVLANDTNDETILRAVVRNLAEQTAFQLRQRRQIARSVTLEIHYADGFRNARKGTLPRNDNYSVVDTCLDLFARANYRRNRIRAIFLDATRLKVTAQQLNLFDTQQESNLALASALDDVRRRFGFDAVKTAAALG